MRLRRHTNATRARRWARAGVLIAVLSLLPTTTRLVLPVTRADAASKATQVPIAAQVAQTSFDAKSWDKSMEQAKKELTPEWWKKLQEAEPSKWIDQYCAAKVFQSTKLCLVVDTAKALRQGVPPEALQANSAALRKNGAPASDTAPGAGADRVPDVSTMPPTQP